MLSYSERKTFARRGAAEIDKTIREAQEALHVQREIERAEARARYKERNKLVPFTREQLEAATVIRTSTGWHRVVRVNAKSVTVETEWSWTERIGVDYIAEVRTATR